MDNDKNPMIDILKNAGLSYDPSAPKGEKVTHAPDVTTDEKMAGAMSTIASAWSQLTDVDAAVRTALEKSVYCKRIEDMVKMIRAEILLAPANAEFAAAMANPAQKTLAIAGAVLKRYSYPQAYEYPQPILEREAQLKADKKAAELSGTAKKLPKVLNPAKDTTFTITA